MRPTPAATAPFNLIKDRYIYTEKGGWIDMAHFMFYAGRGYNYKIENNQTNPVNLAVQDGYMQEITDEIFAPYSAFSYEDLPSDKAGADFGANYFDPNSKLNFGEQLSNYMNNVLKATTPNKAPNFNCLPATEPTDHPSHTDYSTTPSTPDCESSPNTGNLGVGGINTGCTDATSNSSSSTSTSTSSSGDASDSGSIGGCANAQP